VRACRFPSGTTDGGQRRVVIIVAAMGLLVHFLIIGPILDAPPINQLLATGGLLFLLQSFATLLLGTKFIGAANTIYGILLIVFTIFMPVGIWGFVVRCWERRAAAQRARATGATSAQGAGASAR